MICRARQVTDKRASHAPARRQPVRKVMRAELFEGSRVHIALEMDDLAHWRPVIDPFPAIELSGVADGQASSSRRNAAGTGTTARYTAAAIADERIAAAGGISASHASLTSASPGCSPPPRGLAMTLPPGSLHGAAAANCQPDRRCVRRENLSCPHQNDADVRSKPCSSMKSVIGAPSGQHFHSADTSARPTRNAGARREGHSLFRGPP
jgi:hypothetical protein